MTDFSHKS